MLRARGVPQAVDLHKRMELNRPLRHNHSIIAASLGQSRLLRLQNSALEEMDASLWQLPYNSEVLPWRGSQPLTHPARMQMSDQHAWITSGNAEFQFRGRWSPNVNRIITRWLRAYTSIEAPVRDARRWAERLPRLLRRLSKWCRPRTTHCSSATRCVTFRLSWRGLGLWTLTACGALKGECVRIHTRFTRAPLHAQVLGFLQALREVAEGA